MKKKLAIRYRVRGSVPEREIQFNFDGEKITCIGDHGLIDSTYERGVLNCMAENLGVASRELLAAKLSESQELASAARAEAFKKLKSCEEILSLVVDSYGEDYGGAATMRAVQDMRLEIEEFLTSKEGWENEEARASSVESLTAQKKEGE
jgi:hypothetical protein